MAHFYSRQLIVYAVPALAVLLSYFWFKRKRSGKSSDPGEHLVAASDTSQADPLEVLTTISIATPQKGESFEQRAVSTPSTPIDIILPRELRSQRTSPMVISDEDLDLEIEKIKSMRSCSAEKHPRLNELQEASPGTSTALEEDNIPKTESKKSNSSEDKSSMSPMKCKAKKALNQEPQMAEVAAEQQSKPEDVHHASSGRDSANHSPADVMLASPSLSSISDNQSEESNDSGKGGSDVATPPSRTPASDTTMPLVYEFVIAQVLVGKLIGRYGGFVTEIKDKTRAHVCVKKHPMSSKLNLCLIEGNHGEIEGALKMIRERFPLKKFPEVTLEQVFISLPMVNAPITPNHAYLRLVECVNNDTIVSCMVSPGHLFLQQPTHPSYPHLQILSRFMMNSYSNPDSPQLPRPILENTICVAKSLGEWYRAIILSTDEESDTSYVTFLDYGGFTVVPNTELRQIRNDFLLLPFQAAECMLANIKPIGDEAWCGEAFAAVAELTKGTLILTQIADYNVQGIPLVLMFIMRSPQEVISLNDELVKRGYAEYIIAAIDDQHKYQFVDEMDGAVGGITA